MNYINPCDKAHTTEKEHSFFAISSYPFCTIKVDIAKEGKLRNEVRNESKH